MNVSITNQIKTNLGILLQTLVYSNIYLALGAAIIAVSTIFISKYPLVWYLPIIPFSGSFLIYNLNRFTDIKEDIINVYNRVLFIQKFGRIFLCLAILFYTVSLFLAYQQNIYTFISALVPLPIAILYSVARFKKRFILKNILVSIAWGCSVLVVGAFFNTINLLLVYLYAFFSLQFLINVIIFDIKDLKGDKFNNVQSLPVKLGIEETKKVCLLILLLLFVIWILLLSLTIRAVILLPFLLYTATFILAAKDNRPWWYFGVIVDGEFFTIIFAILLWWVAWPI